MAGAATRTTVRAMGTLAFCGLGQMGAPMAARLLDTGDHVVVWNRTPERAVPLVERGARLAASAAEAAAGAEGVFTMLSTPEAVEAVLFGPEGVVHGLAPGATLIEMSTVGPDVVRSVAARLPDGVHLLDAPVLGSVAQATEGTLKVFVGGGDGSDGHVVERWLRVLERFGRPMHLGPLGSGAAMKLVANATLVSLMATLGEALALADGLGLDQGAVLDVLADSPIGVTARSKRSRVESGSYPPNFKLALAAKDARLVTEAAAAAVTPARLAGAARGWFEEAEAAGLGELDYSAVVAHLRGRPAAG